MTVSLVVEFLNYAKSRDAKEVFSYTNSLNCAYAQFLKDSGKAKFPLVGPFDWREIDDPLGDANIRPIPDIIHESVNECFDIDGVRTWGNLVIKLEEKIKNVSC